MISLYPSHIHISFTYPYISHIHKSFIIFACYPATCVFLFLWRWGGVCFSCGFLVSVLWMFSASSSSRLSFRSSLRPVPRFAFRSAIRLVFPFRSSPCLSARPIVSFLRLGVSGGRFVGRAVFVSSLGLAGVYFFFVSWCRGGDVGACRIVDGGAVFGGWRGGASVRGVWRSVWRGVGRVAWRGVGRGVVAFAGYENGETNGRAAGQGRRRTRNGRRDDDGRWCLNAPFLSAPLRRIWDARFSFYLSPDPLLPVLSYLRTSYNPPPAGSGEERVS